MSYGVIFSCSHTLSAYAVFFTGDRVALGATGAFVWPHIDGSEWEWSVSEPEETAKAVSHPTTHLSRLQHLAAASLRSEAS